MNDSNETETLRTTPGRMVLASWAVFAALLVVFAGDINQWAEAAESPYVRDTAKPVAGLLVEVAQYTGIASGREAVQQLINRFYDTPLVLATNELPYPAAEPQTTEASAAAQASASAQTEGATSGATDSRLPKPQSVLLVGDSSIQEGLGTVIERLLESYDGMEINRFGRYSTGLARPDYFDWSAKLRELKAEHEPDLIIAHWGDNDCQGLSTLEGEFICHFGTDEWDAQYGERVEQIITLMREGGANAAIIGLPIMRSKSFSKRVARLNEVTEQATLAAGGFYIPTWDLTSDEDGNYLSSIEFNGRTRLIRAGDGIHLSNHGAEYVADAICRRLAEWFALEPPADEG